MKHAIQAARWGAVLAAGLFLARPGVCAEAKKTRTVKLNLEQSVLRWTGKKLTGAHTGSLRLKSGQVVLAGNDLVDGDFEIDMDSIKDEDLTNSGANAKLVGHLKSADFFDVAQHPSAKFKIRKVAPLPALKADSPTHQITGDLTIKGITKEVAFPATVRIGGGKAEARGAVTLDRTQWDIRFRSGKFYKDVGDKIIYDEIRVELNLTAAL